MRGSLSVERQGIVQRGPPVHPRSILATPSTPQTQRTLWSPLTGDWTGVLPSWPTCWTWIMLTMMKHPPNLRGKLADQGPSRPLRPESPIRGREEQRSRERRGSRGGRSTHHSVGMPQLTKQKKLGGKGSTPFNHQLVSSTPTRPRRETAGEDAKKRKRPGEPGGAATVQDRHQRGVPRVPARVSVGNKENVPTSRHDHHHSQESQEPGGPRQFVETYEVSPRTLNEGVVKKTRVHPPLVKNPMSEQIPSSRGHNLAATEGQPFTQTTCHHGHIQRQHSPQQPGSIPRVATTNSQMMQPPSGISSSQAVAGLPCQNPAMLQQPALVGHSSHVTKDNMPTAFPSRPFSEETAAEMAARQPWISPQWNGVSAPRDGQLWANELQQHAQVTSQWRHVNPQCQEHQHIAMRYPTEPGQVGFEPSRAVAQERSNVRTSQSSATAGSQPGSEKTTQSILRDLVGKLQEMNRSQQAHSGNLSIPHSGTPNPHNSGIVQESSSMQCGTRPLQPEYRGNVSHVGSEKERKIANHTEGLQGREPNPITGVGIGMESTPTTCSNDLNHEPPVRDTGQSCDKQPANQSPVSVVSQMQRIADQLAEEPESVQPRKCHQQQPLDAGKDQKANPRQSTSPRREGKDEVGIQVCTPPQTIRPPWASVTREKGSSALWDQVRTLQYLTRELRTATMATADMQTQDLLSELEEVVETLPYTSLGRDLQTEVSLALQPMRSENSQLRRKLRLASQQLRQLELQAQGKGADQSGVSFEVLTLQSLNVNLQKQVEELHLESDRQQATANEMRATIKSLTDEKRSMQEVFNKMDANIKRKRHDWTLETSNLRQELSHLRSELEAETLKVESQEREKEILRLSVEQRDREIQRLQDMTRDMQRIISTVVPDPSPKTSLPDESKQTRLESWLDQHRSSEGTTNSYMGKDRYGLAFNKRESQRAYTGQRSPKTLDSIQSLLSDSSTLEEDPSPPPLQQPHVGTGPASLRWNSVAGSENFQAAVERGTGIGSTAVRNDFAFRTGPGPRAEGLSLSRADDTFDADVTSYLSFAKPDVAQGKRWVLEAPSVGPHQATSMDVAGRSEDASVWRTENVSELTGPHDRTDRERLQPFSTHLSGLTSAANGTTRPENVHVYANGGLTDAGHTLSHSAEVGSVVSESTISSIATQYEAQFQVGLSKLDADIARLQSNLKGLIKR
ncbi:uncharacterized protein [Diadema setosum]|uniref:uncharacterized protein isoform X2 n=1 Tax=Diadema setosum TaxID=31175 RepID=UPI003B3BE410